VKGTWKCLCYKYDNHPMTHLCVYEDRAQYEKELKIYRTPKRRVALDRFRYDLKDIVMNPLTNVHGEPLESDIFQWHVNVWPTQGPYVGCVFHIILRFPDNYPHSPPTAVINVPVPHSNIYSTQLEDGRYKLCLEMFQGAHCSTQKLMKPRDWMDVHFGNYFKLGRGRHSEGGEWIEDNWYPDSDDRDDDDYYGRQSKPSGKASNERSYMFPSLGIQNPEAPYGGWSSSYTIRSILQQLQCFFDEEYCHRAENKQMLKERERIREITNNQGCKNGCEHRGVEAPWPSASAVASLARLNKGEEGKTDRKPTIDEYHGYGVCFARKVTHDQDLLGVPLTPGIVPGSDDCSINRQQLNVGTDLLSYLGFYRDSIKAGVWITPHPYTSWLPLIINETHAIKSMPLIERVVTNWSASVTWRPVMILKLCSSILNTLIVDFILLHDHEPMQQLRYYEKTLTGFTQFHHMLLAFAVRYPQLREYANETIRRFVEDIKYRRQDHTPVLGDFMMLLLISDFTWLDIGRHVLAELFSREAAAIVSLHNEMKQTVSLCYRMRRSFSTCLDSHRLLMLQCWFINAFRSQNDRDVPVQLARYNRTNGRPPTGFVKRLYNATWDIVSTETWDEFLDFIGLPMSSIGINEALEDAMLDYQVRSGMVRPAVKETVVDMGSLFGLRRKLDADELKAEKKALAKKQADAAAQTAREQHTRLRQYDCQCAVDDGHSVVYRGMLTCYYNNPIGYRQVLQTIRDEEDKKYAEHIKRTTYIRKLGVPDDWVRSAATPSAAAPLAPATASNEPRLTLEQRLALAAQKVATDSNAEAKAKAAAAAAATTTTDAISTSETIESKAVEVKTTVATPVTPVAIATPILASSTWATPSVRPTSAPAQITSAAVAAKVAPAKASVPAAATTTTVTNERKGVAVPKFITNLVATPATAAVAAPTKSFPSMATTTTSVTKSSILLDGDDSGSTAWAPVPFSGMLAKQVAIEQRVAQLATKAKVESGKRALDDMEVKRQAQAKKLDELAGIVPVKDKFDSISKAGAKIDNERRQASMGVWAGAGERPGTRGGRGGSRGGRGGSSRGGGSSSSNNYRGGSSSRGFTRSNEHTSIHGPGRGGSINLRGGRGGGRGMIARELQSNRGAGFDMPNSAYETNIERSIEHAPQAGTITEYKQGGTNKIYHIAEEDLRERYDRGSGHSMEYEHIYREKIEKKAATNRAAIREAAARLANEGSNSFALLERDEAESISSVPVPVVAKKGIVEPGPQTVMEIAAWNKKALGIDTGVRSAIGERVVWGHQKGSSSYQPGKK
jgi:ubiquitin-protein ligase